jgi:hypothetical protein
VALTVAAAIALLQVILSSTFTYTGQKLHDLELRKAELRAAIYQTEADIAALASLERTERVAKERLGMVPARGSQYVSVTLESPAGALLPRPISGDALSEEVRTDGPWWRALLQALPLP